MKSSGSSQGFLGVTPDLLRPEGNLEWQGFGRVRNVADVACCFAECLAEIVVGYHRADRFFSDS
jgi:hypothetical protein